MFSLTCPLAWHWSPTAPAATAQPPPPRAPGLSNSGWNVEDTVVYTAHKAFLLCAVLVRSDSRAAIWNEAAAGGIEGDPGMKVKIKPGFRPSVEQLDWTQRGMRKRLWYRPSQGQLRQWWPKKSTPRVFFFFFYVLHAFCGKKKCQSQMIAFAMLIDCFF